MTTAIFYTPELINYDFGPLHPFRGDRFTSFLQLLRQTLPDHPEFPLITQKTKQLADELTSQKSIDLICSGYNPQILPHAWLHLISALAGLNLPLNEPTPPPNLTPLPDNYIPSLIHQLKSNLSPHWAL